jgi:hypothetical protein
MPPALDNGKRKKSLAASQISLGGNMKINRVAGAINCPVEVCPLAGDPQLLLIHSPGVKRMPEFTAKP